MEYNKVPNFFIGPNAENAEYLKKNLKTIFTDYIYWRKNYCPADKIDKTKNKEWFEKLNYELQKIIINIKSKLSFLFSKIYGSYVIRDSNSWYFGIFCGNAI